MTLQDKFYAAYNYANKKTKQDIKDAEKPHPFKEVGEQKNPTIIGKEQAENYNTSHKPREPNKSKGPKRLKDKKDFMKVAGMTAAGVVAGASLSPLVLRKTRSKIAVLKKKKNKTTKDLDLLATLENRYLKGTMILGGAGGIIGGGVQYHMNKE